MRYGNPWPSASFQFPEFDHQPYIDFSALAYLCLPSLIDMMNFLQGILN
jgi:hypothetical protein